MKTTSTLLASVLLCLLGSSALAADATWSGGTDNTWFTGGNWGSGNAPGATSGTTSTDAATFNTNPANKAPTWTSYLNLGGFTFDTGAGAFTIGTTSGSSAFLSSGGTTQIKSGVTAAQIINAPLVIANDAAAGYGSYSFLNASTTAAATLTLGGAISGQATASNTTSITFNPSAGQTITASGTISNGSAGGRLGLVKSGAGTLILSNKLNTYSGSIAVNSGTLNLNNGTNGTYNPTGANTAGRTLTVASGATLVTSVSEAIDFYSTTVNNLAVTISGTWSNTTGLQRVDTLTLNSGVINDNGNLGSGGYGGVVVPGTLTVSGTSTYNKLASGWGLGLGTNTTINVQGSGDLFVVAGGLRNSNSVFPTAGFTKTGAGTLQVTGSSNYGGKAAINGGVLSLGNVNALGTTGTISFGGGTLQFSGSNTTDYSGRFSTAASQAYSLDTNGQDVTLASALTSSAGSLSKLGDGTLTLTGTNTYSGGTTVNSGTLKVGGSSAIPNGALTVNGGALDLNSNTVTVNSLAGSAGAITTSSVGASALNASVTGTSTFAGSITDGAGTVSLAKSGAGTLTLSGSNTYAGATTLSAGVLVFSNTNAKSASTSVSVAASATLGLGVSGAGAYSSADVDSLFANTMAGVSMDPAAFVGIDTTAGDFTYVGSPGGSRGLAKIGANTLTLTGSNTYSGATTFSSGTLQVGNGITDGSIAGGITNNAALVFNLVGSQSYGNVISGTGNMTKLGAGTLTLTGINTYTGATTISSGTLQVGNGSTDGSIAGPVANSAALVFNLAGSQSYGNVISGTGSFTKSGAGTLTLTGTNTFTGPATISSGTLQLGNGGATGSLATSGTLVNNGTLTFNRSSATAQNTDLPNVITGSGGIVLLGSGTVSLSGYNTYTGNIAVNSGALYLAGGAQNGGTTNGLGTNTAGRTLTVASGATLITNSTDSIDFYSNRVNNIGVTIFGTWINTSNNGGFERVDFLTLNNGVVNDSGNWGGANSLGGILVAGTLTVSGTSTYNQQAGSFGMGIANTTINVPAVSDKFVVAGGMRDTSVSPNASPVKTGSGTLQITGSSNYSGSTTLNGGVLALGNAYALSSGTKAAGTISFGGGTLQFSGSNTTDYSGRFSTAASQAYSLDTNGQSVTLASGLTSSGGSLAKLGAGTLTLTGTSTYSGGTTISSGTLQLGNGGATGSLATSGTITNNGTLVFNRSSATAQNTDLPNIITGSGGIVLLGSGTVSLSAQNSYTGNIAVNAGTLYLGTGVQNSGSTSGLGLNTVGKTLMVASGATLATNATDAIDFYSNVVNNIAVTINGTWNNTAGFQRVDSLMLNNAIVNDSGAHSGFGGICMSGTVIASGTSTYNSLGSNPGLSIGANTTFNVQGASDKLVLASGVTNPTSYVASSGGLTKTGSGTLQITGPSTYTGATAVSAGKLIVSGSLAGTTSLSVSTGAELNVNGLVNTASSMNLAGTLSGSGTVGKVTVQNGGVLAPGNSPGILTTGTLALNAGGSYKLELNATSGTAGTNWDQVAATTLDLGALSNSSKFTLSLQSLTSGNAAGALEGFDPGSNYTWGGIITFGTLAGSFSLDQFTIDTTGFLPAFDGSFSVVRSGNQLDLQYLAIPEPSVVASLVSGLGMLVFLQRRRRK